MSINPQKAHYEQIHDTYAAHYFDPWSMRFREEFIYAPLFRDLPEGPIRVADLACGTGENSTFLKRFRPFVEVVGFDVSEKAVRDYERNVGAPGYVVDLTVPMAVDPGVFDAAMFIGGLHHCVSDLQTTLANVGNMLRPGGLLLLYEPNSRFVFERVRRFWYRRDAYFQADTEAALDHDEINELGVGMFETDWVRYCGGPGYFLILNSMILRVPLRAKPIISPPLMAVERAWNALPGSGFQATFLAQWRKRG